jgi:LacI family transcriptional regulator
MNTRNSAAGRATAEDVARTAGVGVATVDRVLNERGNVAPETARRVIEAARQLGLKRVLPRPYARGLRFEVLLARPDTPFLDRLNRGFASIAGTLDRSVILQRTALPDPTPARVAERIRTCRTDGIILYGVEDPRIIAAVAEVTAAGTPVVSLVTDLPRSRRIAYVGINNERAGRTAGLLTARFAGRRGKVLVLTNSATYRAHADRVHGFSSTLASAAPEMPIAAVLEGRDEEDLASRLVDKALGEPGIVAIYNTGGINPTVAAVIKQRRRAGELVFIGHELTPDTAALLRDGVMTLTIDQAPERQAERAVRVLLQRFGHLDTLTAEPTEVPFTLHTRENAC